MLGWRTEEVLGRDKHASMVDDVRAS